MWGRVDSLSGVLDADDELAQTVFVLGTHHAFEGELGTQFAEHVYHLAEVGLVDVYYQTGIGILHHGLHLRLYGAPPHLAIAVEDEGEIDILFLILNHVGIQA